MPNSFIFHFSFNVVCMYDEDEWWFASLNNYYILDVPSELSWAQAASAAARRGTIFLSDVISSLKSSRHVTRSMDGLDNTVLSDNISMGAAAGMIGYTVNLQPQPLTEPSDVNFHLSSSPLMRNSCDQSDHSRPRKKINKILKNHVHLSGIY